MVEKILVEGFIRKLSINYSVIFVIRFRGEVFSTEHELWFYRANKRSDYKSLLKKYYPLFIQTKKLIASSSDISFYINTKLFLKIYRDHKNNHTRLFKLLDGKE